MLSAVLSWLASALLGALAAFVKDVLADYRAAAAQRELGSADQREADAGAIDKATEEARNARKEIDSADPADLERRRDRWLRPDGAERKGDGLG